MSSREFTKGEEAAMYEVRRALRRLIESEGKGPRARRNARAAFKRTEGKLRELVDESFPAPPRKSSPRRPMTEARLRAAGWVHCTADENRLRAFTTAGVRTRLGPKGNPWAPAWAMELPADPRVLEEAQRDPVRRRALLTEHRLRAAKGPGL